MTATDHADGVAPTRMEGPGRTLETLWAERDFLLRSIADLEFEHGAGELTDDRYEELHDAYILQAATVLRAVERLQHSETDPPTGAPRRRRRAAALVAIALAIMAGGGWLLVRSVGDRRPGQTITGNAQSVAADLDTLERAARDRPDDPGAQLGYAHGLLQAGRPVDALKAFDDAARLDPGNPEPQAYAGWIVFLAGLPDEALPRLDAAIAVDPTYPDARFFRGMVLVRGRGDTAGGLSELREFVRLAPAGPERDQVQALITDLEQPVSTPTTIEGSP